MHEGIASSAQAGLADHQPAAPARDDARRRSRSELAGNAQAISVRRHELLAALIGEPSEDADAGCSALHPLWAKELTHRAHSLLRLVLLLERRSCAGPQHHLSRQIELPAFQRRALVLAADELAVNAPSHAFDGRRQGRLIVSLRLAGRQRARLVVADDGRDASSALPRARPRSRGRCWRGSARSSPTRPRCASAT